MYSLNFCDDGHRAYPVGKNKHVKKNGKPVVFTVTDLKKNDILRCVCSHFAETVNINNDNVDRLQIMSCDALIDTVLKMIELAGINKRNISRHAWVLSLRDKLEHHKCYEKLKNAQLKYHSIKDQDSHEAIYQLATIDAMHIMIENTKRDLINFVWNNKMSHMQ